MSKQLIDIGSGPSTGDGDPLRVAFNKINQNFDELYSGTAVLTPISSNNTNQTSSVGPFVYDSPVKSVAGRTGNVVLTVQDIIGAAKLADVTYAINQGLATSLGNISQNIVPRATATYSLGSPSKQWDSAWFAGNIHVGGSIAVSSITSANTVISGGSINSTPIGATAPSTGAFTTLSSSGQTRFTANIASTSCTTGTVVVTGGVGISGNLNVKQSVTAPQITLGNGVGKVTYEVITARSTNTSPQVIHNIATNGDVAAVEYTMIATRFVNNVAMERHSCKLMASILDGSLNYHETSTAINGGVLGDFSMAFFASGSNGNYIQLSVTPAYSSGETVYKIFSTIFRV